MNERRESPPVPCFDERELEKKAYERAKDRGWFNEQMFNVKEAFVDGYRTALRDANRESPSGFVIPAEYELMEEYGPYDLRNTPEGYSASLKADAFEKEHGELNVGQYQALVEIFRDQIKTLNRESPSSGSATEIKSLEEALRVIKQTDCIAPTEDEVVEHGWSWACPHCVAAQVLAQDPVALTTQFPSEAPTRDWLMKETSELLMQLSPCYGRTDTDDADWDLANQDDVGRALSAAESFAIRCRNRLILTPEPPSMAPTTIGGKEYKNILDHNFKLQADLLAMTRDRDWWKDLAHKFNTATNDRPGTAHLAVNLTLESPSKVAPTGLVEKKLKYLTDALSEIVDDRENNEPWLRVWAENLLTSAEDLDLGTETATSPSSLQTDDETEKEWAILKNPPLKMVQQLEYEERIKELEARISQMKEMHDFGVQCYQDDCENAYVHSTVHNLAKKRIKELGRVRDEAIEKYAACVETKVRQGDELIAAKEQIRELKEENARLNTEVKALRLYGNRDCIAMADAALEEGDLLE